MLGIWRVHTTATSSKTVPFCKNEQDCTKIFHNMITNSSLPLEADLGNRMWCNHDVEVPDYFLDAIANESASHHVSTSDQGNLMFTKRVCTCDISAGFEGENCHPNAQGLVLQSLFVLAFVWVGYLVLWTLTTLTRGHLKSVAKKRLAWFALIQFVAQMVWISGYNAFPYNGDRATLTRSNRKIYAGLLTIVGVFLFMCGMTVSILRFVAEGSADIKIKNRLNWLASRLRTIPFIMGAIFLLMWLTDPANALIPLAVIYGSIAMLISTMYSYCINVLDQRVLRLLPKNTQTPKKKGLKTRMHSSLLLLWGTSATRQSLRVNKVHIVPDEDNQSVALLCTSRRLQDMASSQRRHIRIVILNFGLYALSDANIRLDYLSSLIWLSFNVNCAILPMQGLGGLSAFSPAKTVRGIHQTYKQRTRNLSSLQTWVLWAVKKELGVIVHITKLFYSISVLSLIDLGSIQSFDRYLTTSGYI